MRIMLHDPHPTRRHDPQRTPPFAAYRPVRHRPQPPGDGPALRRPRIARHLGCHPHTARAALKGYRDRGVATFQPQRPGPPPDQQRRQTVTARLTALLGQDRTWTSRQLAEALQPDIVLSPRQLLRYLAVLKARYRRTAPTVRHKQDPAKVARAKQVLGGLKKKRRPAA